jgi:hypothetical protein
LRLATKDFNTLFRLGDRKRKNASREINFPPILSEPENQREKKETTTTPHENRKKRKNAKICASWMLDLEDTAL